jgi:hypothetical protein
MAPAQVGDGGDGFQILRITANILNMQLLWSSIFGVGYGAKNDLP